MSCSRNSPTKSADWVREPLAGGGVRDMVQPGKPDLSDWVELREAVEALCPVWPSSGPKRGHGEYRL